MTETETRKAKLSDSFGGTVEKDIPENAEWIDDAFYIKKTRFGLYTSILKARKQKIKILKIIQKTIFAD